MTPTDEEATSPLPGLGKRVLVVGAGGFVGGFAVEEGLRRGYEVWAGLRKTTSRKYLADKRIHFLELTFDDPSRLSDELSSALPPDERWDYIIYNLGATKCLNFADFNTINYEYLRYFTGALGSADMMPRKMLYMSSLSVMGPGDEKTYTPFTPDRIPIPNTRYGASKLKAEMWLASSKIPYIIFRATGIYGPRDKDYFLMFKSIARGFDFSVGFRRQMLTFIYVEDLTRAMYDALEKAPVRTTYIVAEDAAYTQKQFRTISKRILGKRLVIPICVPIPLVGLVSKIAEKWGVLRMKPSTLNSDKFNILRQRNWNADISAARTDFGFNPQVSLEQGVERAVSWYRDEKWL